jgi:hypothetical protein
MGKRYRKEDHAAPKKKTTAPKAKSKNTAPSSTGRKRKPVDSNATTMGQAMQDAAAAKGSTIEDTFPQPTPIEEKPEVASALKVAAKEYSTKRHPNSLSEDVSHHVILKSMMDNLENRVNSIRLEDPFTKKTELRGTYAKGTKQVLNILAQARGHADNALHAHLNGDSLSAAPSFLKATDLLHEALTHANNTIATRSKEDPATGRLLPIVNESGIPVDSRNYGGFLRHYKLPEQQDTISLHPMDTPKQLTDLANGYVNHALTSEFTGSTDVIEKAKKLGNLTREYKQDEPSPSFSDVDVPGVSRTLSSEEEEELVKNKQKRLDQETLGKAKKNAAAGRVSSNIVRGETEVVVPDTSESPQVLAKRAQRIESEKQRVESTLLEDRHQTGSGVSEFPTGQVFGTFTPWDRDKVIAQHKLETRALREKAFQVWNADQNRNLESKKALLSERTGREEIPKTAKDWVQREPVKTWVGSEGWQDPEKFLLKMAVKDHWLARNRSKGYAKAHEFDSTDAAANPEAYIAKNNLEHTGFFSNRLIPKGTTEEKTKFSTDGDTAGFATPSKEEGGFPEPQTSAPVDEDEAKEAEFNKMKKTGRSNGAFEEGRGV